MSKFNSLTIKGNGPPLYSGQVDQNFLSLMLLAGQWDVADAPYEKNQTAWHEGILWLATKKTSAEPTRDVSPSDWYPLTLLNGRGSMSLSAPIAAPAIGAGWNPITEFDQLPVAGLGVSFDLPTGTFVFAYPGVWQLSLSFVFEHNSSNQGRTTNVRLYDVTDAIAGRGVVVGTGRNAEASSLAFSVLVDIDPATVGKTFRVEVGGGSSYSSVQYDSLSLDLLQVGL